jgi:hypothetical protein
MSTPPRKPMGYNGLNNELIDLEHEQRNVWSNEKREKNGRKE